MPRVAGPCRHLGRQNVFRADLAAIVQVRPVPRRLSTAFSLAAASPVWELWASSAITAKRLPWVAASSRTASMAKGKVWIVQTTIFLSPESASASSRALAAVLAGDGRHHAAGALEIEEGFLKLRVDDGAVGDDQHGIEDLLGSARRAARPGSARSRRWSWSCPNRPSAGSGTCRPGHP